MTIIACPHGCGGVVDTAKYDYCPSCRRGLNETEVIVPDDMDADAYGAISSPVTRKLKWCWQWWGPADHRMRCRLPAGHDGEHDTHEERIEGNIIVSTSGEKIA